MVDADLGTHAQHAGEDTAAARERARNEIRLELDRLGAHEHARHALEVMAESYLRFVRSAGPAGYRIVDDNEKPRTRDGSDAAFTIGDLVAELRERLPTLFKDGVRAAGNGAAATSAPAAVADAAATASPLPPASGGADEPAPSMPAAEDAAPGSVPEPPASEALGTAPPAEPEPLTAAEAEPRPPLPPVRDWLHLVPAGEPVAAAPYDSRTADPGSVPPPAETAPAAAPPQPVAAPAGQEAAAAIPGREMPDRAGGPPPGASQPWAGRLTAAFGAARAQLSRARVRAEPLRTSASGVFARVADRLQPWHAAAAAAFLVGILGVLLASALFPGAPEPTQQARREAQPKPAEQLAPKPPATPPPATAQVPEKPAAQPPAAVPPPAPTPAPQAPAPAPAPPAAPAPSAAAERPSPPARELRGIPEVIDTATLRLEGKLVRLFGVEWDRGGVADEMASYLRGRAVTCTPTGAVDTYRCNVDGRDLSQVVLYNGGGRAASGAPPELVEAESHARAEKLGVWSRQ